MASDIRVELNHSGIEDVEDSFSGMALQLAEGICSRANAMRSSTDVAEYNVNLRKGRKGGRRYAVVSADAPSTVADDARNNTLAKAMG